MLSSARALLLAAALVGCTQTNQEQVPDRNPDLHADPPTSDLSAAPSPDLAVALPGCELLLGGPALPATSTEAQPGFDEQLAALDLSQLPAQLDLSTATDLTRATIGYLLGKTYAELGTSLDRDAALAILPLGKVVVAAFASADPTGAKAPDFLFLRRGIHRYYHCARSYPLTLDGFRRTIWDYTRTSGQIITSVPKAGPRRIYAEPALGVYVAETLVDGSVRETEVQVAKRRADGAIDFLSYDHLGQQVRTDTFATGGGGMRVAPSPYTCMACHYDKNARSFSAIIPVN